VRKRDLALRDGPARLAKGASDKASPLLGARPAWLRIGGLIRLSERRSDRRADAAGSLDGRSLGWTHRPYGRLDRAGYIYCVPDIGQEANGATLERRDSRMVLAAGAVKIAILVVVTVVIIVVYSFLRERLQRRGP
jgi:hypothetical protein